MDHSLSIFRSLTFDGCIYVKIHSKAEVSAICVQLIKNGAVVATQSVLEKFVRFKGNAEGTYKALAELTLGDGTVVDIASQEIVIEDSPVVSQIGPFPAETNQKGGHWFVDDVKHYDLELKLHKGRLQSIESESPASIPRFLALRTGLAVTKISLKAFWQDDSDEEDCDRYHIQCALDKHEVLALAQELEQLDYVFYCALVPDPNELPSPELPFLSEQKTAESHSQHTLDAAFTTPSFHHLQTYMDDGRGMNVRQLWATGETGRRVTVHFLDFGVWPNHENLIGNLTVMSQPTENADMAHGTASAGCIAANNVSFGVRGIAHGCEYRAYATTDLDSIVRDAVVGDIVALSIQFRAEGVLLPAIAITIWRERIRIMSDRGVIVLLAAGNGFADLSTNPVMNRGANTVDSGSILIGAANPGTGARIGFSNFGHFTSLLNSWGQGVATTGGRGELQWAGDDRSYTANYSGTSSALPLCTGAIALIQSVYMSRNMIINPLQLRQIIARTGFNDLGQGIGRRPNAFRAAQEIGILPSILDTAEDLARLGQDASGAWLAQLVAVHGRVSIIARNGIWTERIVLPAASSVAFGNSIDIVSHATLNITVMLENVPFLVGQGQSFRFIVLGATWQVLAGPPVH